MYRILTLCALALPLFTWAQHQELPNHEFDDWNSSSIPTDWATFETAFGPGSGIVEQDSTDKENGPFSLKVVTPAQTGFIPYSLVTLKDLHYDFQTHRIITRGIGYQSRPDTAWVLYKYEVPNNGPDTAGFALTLQGLDTNAIPTGVMDVVLPFYQTSEWTLESYPLTNHYTSAVEPDSMYFSLISSVTQPRTPGATLSIDGIYFNNPTETETPPDTNATGTSSVAYPSVEVTVFPNPSAHRNISIRSSHEVGANCTFRMYNALGQLVTDEKVQVGNHVSTINLGHVTSGSFLYILINEHNEIVSKGRLLLH